MFLEVETVPIYEYRCDSCQHIFEELQRHDDPAPEACPKCEKSPVRRLISNSTFHLKGGGWFASDNPPSSSPASTSAPENASVSTDVVTSSESTSVTPAATTKEST